MDEDSSSPEEIKDIFCGNALFAIAWSTFFTLTQVTSDTLLATIICYEFFAGDPQKRTILNRLHSFMAMSTLGVSVSQGSVLVIRPLTGPLNELVIVAVFDLPRMAFSYCNTLCLMEKFVLKWLSIVLWKRIPPINDEFFSTFFLSLNLLISLGLTLIRNAGFLGVSGGISIVLSGKERTNDQNLPSFPVFVWVIGIACIIYILLGLHLALRNVIKGHSSNAVETPAEMGQVGNHYNNQGSNDSLFSPMVHAFVASSIIYTLLAHNFLATSNFLLNAIFKFIIPYVIFTLGVPLIICQQKPAILNYLRSSLEKMLRRFRCK